MKKRNRFLLAALAVLALAAGCNSDKSNTALTPTPAAATPTPWASDGFRVGNKVSDAYVDPDTYLTPKPEDVKAKGFDYEYDSLEYELVWFDEFDYEGAPDETKWGYDTGGSGWGNNELQYYTAGDNVTVKDGYLTIEARKEAKGTKDYTSTRLVTRGKGDWLYGKVEVCAKLPTGKGTWPAIWMLPTDWKYGDWPASGEIDIMEHVGYDQDKIHGTVHTASYNHSINTQKGKSVNVKGVSEEFHVYTLEWLPDKILISVDGKEYFNFEPTKYKENPTSAEWPFDQRMHLLINFAVGGNWGGARGVDDSVYPQEFVVDYVRVYQSPQISQIERVDTDVENPFLKADGKVLRDTAGTGDVVQLKGTNAGGYLFQEFWMTPTNVTSKVKAEEDLYAVLASRFGEEKMYELMNVYQDAYWTEADFDYCKELGMNCIRLPFWYRNLVDENGTFYENWSERLDWFVAEAAERKLYVILDFHGAPGSQNGSDHSGKDGGDNKKEASEFFFGDYAQANRELYYKIWEKLAEHYKGNPWIAGYDLLNEPYCTYRYNSGLSDRDLRKMLWDIYDTAYDRIRAIDSDHVIILEATWDPVDLPDPKEYGWENVMYEYHNYLYDDYDNAKGQQIKNMKKKLDAIAKANYEVPSYLGEFAFFNNLDAWEEGLRMINDTGISWTTWTYKVIAEYGNWGIRNQKNWKVNPESNSYDMIANAWSDVGESNENSGLARVLQKYFKLRYVSCE